MASIKEKGLVSTMVDPRLNDGLCPIKRRIRVSSIIWEGGLGPQEMDLTVYLSSYKVDPYALKRIIIETNKLEMGEEGVEAFPTDYDWRFLA